MVASLEEAFGIRSFKKKKSCRKDFEKAGFSHHNATNVYNEDKFFDSNTNINSNDIYQDKNHYPHRRPMKRNRIPRVLLEQDSDNPIKLGGIPIEMGAAEQPSDGDFAYAPGGSAEKAYMDDSPDRSENNDYSQYMEEDPGLYSDEYPAGEDQYDSGEQLVEGMVDYQTFERGVQRSIQDLSEKVNKLISGGSSNGSSGDPLSNSADVVLYIFTGIFFLFLFDMAFKIGKLKR